MRRGAPSACLQSTGHWGAIHVRKGLRALAKSFIVAARKSGRLRQAAGVSAWLRTIAARTSKRRDREGLVVSGIAYGRYRAGVSLEGATLQLRLFGADPGDAFSVNVIHDFTMGHLGNQFIVEARR